MHQVLRLIFAISEVALVMVFADDVFVNPGLGMYGWGYGFPGFPTDMDGDDISHFVLSISASAAYCACSRGVGMGSESIVRQFVAGVMAWLPFYYPIYDSKHWFPSDRLANYLNEYLILYALLAAVSDFHRGCSLKTQLNSSPEGFSSHLLDWYLATLLSISTTLFLCQFCFERFGWDPPDSHVECGSQPGLGQYYCFSGYVWSWVFSRGFCCCGTLVILTTAVVQETMASRAHVEADAIIESAEVPKGNKNESIIDSTVAGG